mmetsp:Transcript_24312/g.67596  ORF Transcript_24312/g.67596 Transcript_24312/m.67596 type:complete len:335 (+) Transcript_24312:1729-2733(+)
MAGNKGRPPGSLLSATSLVAIAAAVPDWQRLLAGEVQPVVLAEHLYWLVAHEEVNGRGFLAKVGHSFLVAITMSALLVLLLDQRIGACRGGGVLHLRENVLWVEQPGVNLGGRLVAHANHEDLGRCVTGSRGLVGLDLGEQLLEGVQQSVVVLGPEDLCDKSPLGDEELRGKLEGLQHEEGLRGGLRGPGAAHVWGAIVQHAVALLAVEHLLQSLPAGLRGNVAHKGLAAADGADGVQVHTDAEAVNGHVLGCHLEPAAWGGAQIDDAAAVLKESIPPVELDELEGGAGTVPLLLGKMVELVQPMFSTRLLPHGVSAGGSARPFVALAVSRLGW